MNLADTLIACTRLAIDEPALDVRWIDQTSAWLDDERNVTIRSLGWRGLGVDDVRLTTEGSVDVRETVHGVRVFRAQFLIGTTNHDPESDAPAIADRIRAGFHRSDVGALLESANLAAPAWDPVVSAPMRGDNANTRSVAVLEGRFNASRTLRGALIPAIVAARTPVRVLP